MNNPKIIGCIIAWASELWIGPAIKQALAHCDEVFVCIEPHSPLMGKFEDSTFERANRYRDRVKFVKLKRGMMFPNHSSAKAIILNMMMKSSEFFEVGNWIFILDVDEFYNEDCFHILKNQVLNEDIDVVEFQSKYFFIDTKHYLIGEHPRMFKITDKETNHFIPTQNWSKSKIKVVTIPKEIGMYHYGMMTNPWAKLDFWRSEYPGKTQDNKVTWLDEIYRGYDLQDEGTWITKNEQLFGIRSPWFADSYRPNEDGRLFTYDGRHPIYVEEAGLTDITDYRKIYSF